MKLSKLFLIIAVFTALLFANSVVLGQDGDSTDITSDTYIKQGKYRKAAHYLMNEIRLQDVVTDRKTKARLYKNLAVVLNKLHLYPQALKCYNKVLQCQQDRADIEINNTGLCEEIELDESDTLDFAETHNSTQTVSNTEIVSEFADGKQAVAYGIVLHVKQPLAGKRLRFIRINQVGHTFITLIKYNNDCTQVSRSFGYYPRKTHLLSATPLSPLTSSQFKDDAAHDWHELVAKFISPQQYDSILALVVNYADKPYHLSNNNCTDFGLQAAAIAGIDVRNTQGAWPLGYGDNPGDAGESILEGHISNNGTNNSEGLFICTYSMYPATTKPKP